MKKIISFSRMFFIIAICTLCLIPFYVLLTISLNSPERSLGEGNIFLPDFIFSNYIDAFEKSHIGNAIMNSALITLLALVIIIIFASMAGYAIARFPNQFHRFVFSVMLCCMMIPGIINTVPLYTLMRKIGAIDTIWGMAAVCATNAMPSAVFIFTGFVRAIPKELEEAAIIDGCTRFKAYWKIIFAMLKPSIASVVILNGFGIWNNYSQAVFFLQSQEKHNVAQALSVFFQQFAGAKWHLMSATAVIAVIPVIIIFTIFQKQLMKGLMEGAVKG